MRRAYIHRFFSLLIGIGLILFLASCVDTTVQNIPQSLNYMSQVNFVNLVPMGGTATLTLSGTQLGTVDLGAETPSGSFTQVPAGSKTLSVSYASGGSEQFNFVTETDAKLRIYIVGDSSFNSVVKSFQRYIWQNKGTSNGASLFPADTIQITIFNASPDAEVTGLRLYDGAGVDMMADVDVAYKDASGYVKFGAPDGSYSLDVVTADTTITIGTSSYATQSRYTAVIYDYSSLIKGSVFTDD